MFIKDLIKNFNQVADTAPRTTFPFTTEAGELSTASNNFVQVRPTASAVNKLFTVDWGDGSSDTYQFASVSTTWIRPDHVYGSGFGNGVEKIITIEFDGVLDPAIIEFINNSPNANQGTFGAISGTLSPAIAKFTELFIVTFQDQPLLTGIPSEIGALPKIDRLTLTDLPGLNGVIPAFILDAIDPVTGKNPLRTFNFTFNPIGANTLLQANYDRFNKLNNAFFVRLDLTANGLTQYPTSINTIDNFAGFDSRIFLTSNHIADLTPVNNMNSTAKAGLNRLEFGGNAQTSRTAPALTGWGALNHIQAWGLDLNNWTNLEDYRPAISLNFGDIDLPRTLSATARTSLTFPTQIFWYNLNTSVKQDEALIELDDAARADPVGLASKMLRTNLGTTGTPTGNNVAPPVDGSSNSDWAYDGVGTITDPLSYTPLTGLAAVWSLVNNFSWTVTTP